MVLVAACVSRLCLPPSRVALLFPSTAHTERTLLTSFLHAFCTLSSRSSARTSASCTVVFASDISVTPVILSGMVGRPRLALTTGASCPIVMHSACTVCPLGVRTDPTGSLEGEAETPQRGPRFEIVERDFQHVPNLQMFCLREGACAGRLRVVDLPARGTVRKKVKYVSGEAVVVDGFALPQLQCEACKHIFDPCADGEGWRVLDMTLVTALRVFSPTENYCAAALSLLSKATLATTLFSLASTFSTATSASKPETDRTMHVYVPICSLAGHLFGVVGRPRRVHQAPVHAYGCSE